MIRRRLTPDASRRCPANAGLMIHYMPIIDEIDFSIAVTPCHYTCRHGEDIVVIDVAMILLTRRRYIERCAADMPVRHLQPSYAMPLMRVNTPRALMLSMMIITLIRRHTFVRLHATRYADIITR